MAIRSARAAALTALLFVCAAPSHAQAPVEHLIAPIPAAYKPAGKICWP